MQISKSFLLVCVAAYCVAWLPLRAADADTELKLRQALEKKLDELQTQPPASAPTPAVTAPKPVPAPVAAPAAPPAQPTPTLVVSPPPQAVPPRPAVETAAPALVAPPPVDSEAIAKAREALRKKMAELEAQSPSAPAIPAPPAPAVVAPPAPIPAQSTPAFQPVPVAVPPATVAPVAPTPAVPAAPVAAEPIPTLVAPPPADAESIAKARSAMEAKMKELETQAPVVMMPAPTPPARKGALTFPPLQPPPLGISAAKEQRLQALLQQYRADQITPEQYQEQRAKILAEP